MALSKTTKVIAAVAICTVVGFMAIRFIAYMSDRENSPGSYEQRTMDESKLFRKVKYAKDERTAGVCMAYTGGNGFAIHPIGIVPCEEVKTLLVKK